MDFKSVELAEYQAQALTNPFTHFIFWAGIAGGKTATGSHFIIKQLFERPELTYFVGANTQSQLSKATLAELFNWLTHYRFEFVYNKRPPTSWNCRRLWPDYNGILSIRNPYQNVTTSVMCRILSNIDFLRGVTFSSYWIDETRDTTEYAFNVLQGRLRESDYIKGLITTTTNGDDWLYKNFLRYRRENPDGKMWGAMHVPTTEAVEAGFITQAFLDQLLTSYSPLMAEQEIYARHVNINEGRAYYALKNENRRSTSPEGRTAPDPAAPLIIGCDFNYAPSPCVWVVGQLEYHNGRNVIHWYEEVSATEVSTRDMTIRVMQRFPGYYYRFFGDASATRSTTSNAGVTDLYLIQSTVSEYGGLCSTDFDLANPLVRDRVENVNGLLYNARGEVTMTYNPDMCPLLDSDLKRVGWRKMVGIQTKPKLDPMGDATLTHASDAVGYALYKLFPPATVARMAGSVQRLHAGLEF